MPVIKRSLTTSGALLDVVVGWSAAHVRRLVQAAHSVPSPIQATALIDTGAEMTCVDTTLARRLAFPMGGLVPANVPMQGGVTFGSIFPASIVIAHHSGDPKKNLTRRDILVMELPLQLPQYQVLIGRDILDKIKFLYDGIQQHFALKY